MSTSNWQDSIVLSSADLFQLPSAPAGRSRRVGRPGRAERRVRLRGGRRRRRGRRPLPLPGAGASCGSSQPSVLAR